MRNRILATLITMALLVGSCKTNTGVIGSTTANSSLTAKDIIGSHKQATPNFKTLAARVQVAYEDEKKEQSITVSLRMEKDKRIWIKASILGITLAKVLITPDRVSYYETISNTFFDGDFALLSDWLGTDLDYDKTQAILLGQSIFDLGSSYKSTISQNRYKLQPRQQPQNFIHSLLLHPEHFKVMAGSLSQPSEDRMLSMQYGNYQKLEGSYYPTTIRLDASENNDKTKIDVKYKKIDLNVSVSFPFTIPDGYEEIELVR